MKKLVLLSLSIFAISQAHADINKEKCPTGGVYDDLLRGCLVQVDPNEKIESERYYTKIDGQRYVLTHSSGNKKEIKNTLKLLESAIKENNKLTVNYLKINSPAWKDLMTDELKANNNKFQEAWKRIVIERHYNKDVLDAYEKYEAAKLANREKMLNHFYALSKNEPFKEKVRAGHQADKNHFINEKAVIKRLRTYL